jgi:hypothetical protein
LKGRNRLKPTRQRGEKPIKNIIDTRVPKIGDPGLKVIEMIDTQDAEDKNLAGIISRSILTKRGRDHDVIDPYRVAQTLLRNQLRPRMITSEDSESDSEMSG